MGSAVFNATLQDNAAGNVLKSLLPMTLNMNELNGNEKYCNLARNLPTAAVNPGTGRVTVVFERLDD